MGCVSSKQVVTVKPAVDHSGAFRDNAAAAACCRSDVEDVGQAVGVGLEKTVECRSRRRKGSKRSGSGLSYGGSELGESGRTSSNCRSDSLSFRLGQYLESEQVAAGWPDWLSTVAGEAIHGWVPLRSDAFEKLEKIGQGTYSSVFRARELETGRIVAMKKVRFDNFEPESVRFMAREISILRRLDHPNVIKLEGLITSRLSCNIYLVFEYMEHDVTGLLSRPDIKFSESQIKCYMKQLLSGLDHCHSRGIMHRDIKGSNLLVNNEGVLKVADFGLANFSVSRLKHPLTSRVVTLWYRPPELLLGSTDYGAAVDLWSIGCVFAELLLGKPILQGRTEVEQLHKIFKLCGSPPEDYWKKSKLPHATLYKPQQPYNSSLRETFKDLPTAAVNLIEALLSIEPHKRVTASSALASEYFATKPYACEPSSLPVYPPSKEIDAKNREDAKRKKISGRACGPETRKPTRKPHAIAKLAPIQDVMGTQSVGTRKLNGSTLPVPKDADVRLGGQLQKLSVNELKEGFHVKNASQGEIPFPGPLQVSKSSGFAWAKGLRDNASSIRSHRRTMSKGHIFNAFEPPEKDDMHSKLKENGDDISGIRTESQVRESYEIAKRTMLKQWRQLERPDSFDASDEYHSQELSLAPYHREKMTVKRNNLGYRDKEEKVEFSGPLLSQSHRIDELLERHERQIRHLVRRSWFHKGKKQGKQISAVL